MTDKQQAVIDAWISLDPTVSCVVYVGWGEWWPAKETNDGPQPIGLGGREVNYGPKSLTTIELVAWCEARLAEAASA